MRSCVGLRQLGAEVTFSARVVVVKVFRLNFYRPRRTIIVSTEELYIY